MIELTASDQQTVFRLGYTVTAQAHRVAGDWDSLAILDGEDRVGAITIRSGGGYVASLSGRVWELDPDGFKGGHRKRAVTGRGESVGEAIQSAHEALQALMATGRREQERYARIKR